MNNLTNKLIIVAGVILVLLIVVTIFISSFGKKTQSGKQPTLVPTGFFESTGERMKLTLSESELKQEVTEINSRLLSTGQVEKLDEIKTKLPVSTNNFALGYSEIVGQFYIQKKTPQADTAVQKFFQDNNFLDVYQKYPELFVTTKLPIQQAISQAEQNFTSKTSPSSRGSSNPDLPSLSFSEFSSLIGSLFYQDTEKVKKALDESNKELEGQTTTGTSQQGGNLPSQPYDGGGTPQLKKIMSVIKAIPGLTWGGVCANPAAGGHIPNSEHYHCNAVDVFGSETILDNAFADLLAAAKRDELPIHCLIYERHSYSRESNWAQHDYSGASTHDSHIHISGWPSVGGAC